MQKVTVGQLRHRVDIETPTQVQSDSGAVTYTWSVLASRWAFVEPLTGRELWNAQQVQPDVTTRVWLRHLDGVTPMMRIKHNDRYLYIESVINRDERDIQLELLCKESV